MWSRMRASQLDRMIRAIVLVVRSIGTAPRGQQDYNLQLQGDPAFITRSFRSSPAAHHRL